MNPSTLSPPPRVLILGAGWLGWPMGERWAQLGAHVTTVRRRPHAAVPRGTALALELATIDASGSSPESVAATLGRHDLVIAAVAPDRSQGDSHTSTYPAAAKAAVAVARACGASALAWVSSTGVYGYVDGREVFEHTPRSGAGAAHLALCEAEDTILAAAAPAMRVGVFRVAGLYGPDRDPAARYRDASALVGRSAHWLNLAWRDDVISAVQHWSNAALRGDDVPTVLNVSDGTPLTVAECARLVAQADGRAFVPPPETESETAPARSNQRIRVDALRAMGWTPEVPHLRLGLLKLGYSRLAPDAQPYGPQTAAIRAYLRALASLSPEAHERVLQSWARTSITPAFARADRVLGETMVRADREAERDAAAGPLLQMLRSNANGGNANEGEAQQESTHRADDLDAIAEPALAALMALVVRDLLPHDVFAELVRAVGGEIELEA